MSTYTETEATPGSEFSAAFEAGQEFQQGKGNVQQINGGVPFIWTARGAADMEKYLPKPVRIRETAVMTDLPSFVRYVNTFKDEDTRVFAMLNGQGGASFRAVLDYHRPGLIGPAASTFEATQPLPRWGEHVAMYSFPITPEWHKILQNNNRQLSQDDFGDLVEELRVCFKKPDGATMLELARNLSGRTEGVFRSSVNVHNGDRDLLWTTNTSAVGGKGETLHVPTQLEFFVAPFMRGQSLTIPALFRYRVREGEVTFQYVLDRAHAALDVAVSEAAKQVQEKTGIEPFFGDIA